MQAAMYLTRVRSTAVESYSQMSQNLFVPVTRSGRQKAHDAPSVHQASLSAIILPSTVSASEANQNVEWIDHDGTIGIMMHVMCSHHASMILWLKLG
jgi:hypothetical protein